MGIKVRTITTYEGIYLNADDIKTLINDDQVMRNCLAMLVVGHDTNRPIEESMRRALAIPFAMACGMSKAGEVLAERKFWFRDGDGI